ncbi:4-hydroxy-4-methyl-2-oxoglutarate aldolase [Catalinimonas alkaloidigena]|uniref:RraA family protein n=1 Tax=Catalinimonas alkaloidigena TaxID=1075417 RepID=UPI0024060102|nr:RraA family protein [Catalinimonas alkaloidigena]MDF9796347.1 4-hydroxy-4-methyl-2-oxoglutarate aldolase [Catalinimonas alkaloidigena]
MKYSNLIFAPILLFSFLSVYAQNITMSQEEMIALTPKWEGGRFPDGRPKVPDSILERMKNISLEQAWSVLRGEGYTHQYEYGWQNIHPGDVLVGRVLTAQYMPVRPEVREQLVKKGTEDGRIGDMVSWPIDMLIQGDVYVADSYGKVTDGPIIGDNLGTSIAAKSGNGVVVNGTVRDMEGLMQIPGFTSFIKGSHPSYQQEMMLTGLNVPIRIGPVTVMPGDVVLGKLEGVIFIPPHLAEKVVKTGELVMLRDQFGHQRLREGKYTPGQIDARWNANIERDFSEWLEAHIEDLAVPKEEIQELLKTRNW